MTIGDIATKARAITHSDSVSYTDANLLIDINIWYQKVASMILESQDDTDFDDARDTTYPIATTPMVANQRDYPIGVAQRMLKVKRVDTTYDGTNWFRANSIDTGVIGWGISYDQTSQIDPTLDQNFSAVSPMYDIAYNSIWLFPMPVTANVTAGGTIRMEWERNVVPFTGAELTTGTAIPGFDAPFQPILAWGAAFEFASANNLPQLQMIAQQCADYESRLRIAYSRKELDTIMMLAPAQSYGDMGNQWGFGNGYN